MTQDLKALQEKFVQDLFVSEGLGAVIEEADYGYAKCSMEIQPRHCPDYLFEVCPGQAPDRHSPPGQGRQAGVFLRG